MSTTREKKRQIINQLKEKILKQKIMIFVMISGLKTKSLFVLRKRLKTTEAEMKVAKKSLINIVFKELELNFNPAEIEGEIALIFGYKDEVTPVKILCEFSQENSNLKILGGILENIFINSEKIIELGKLPSRKELLVKLISTISNPILNFINILQGNIKNLIYVLNAIKVEREIEKNKN